MNGETLTEYVKVTAGSLIEDAEYVAERMKGKETGICVSGMKARVLREYLKEQDWNTKLVFPFLPLLFHSNRSLDT